MPISPDYQPIDFQSLGTEQERIDRALEIAKIWNAKTRALVAPGAAPDLNEIKGSFEVIESVREQIMDLKLSGLASGDAIEPRINLLVNARIDALIKVLLANGESYASVHQELRKISGGDPALTEDYLLRLKRVAEDLGIPIPTTGAAPTPTPTPAAAGGGTIGGTRPPGGGAPRPTAGAGGAGTPPPAGHTPTGAGAGTPPHTGGGAPPTPGGGGRADWGRYISDAEALAATDKVAARRKLESYKRQIPLQKFTPDVITDLELQIDDALDRLKGLASSAEKEVDALSFEELINELIKEKVDPVESKWGKELTVGRRNDLLKRFMREQAALGSETDRNEYLKKQALRVKYLLKCMTVKIDINTGGASVERYELFGKAGEPRPNPGWLDMYMLKRDEVLAVTTQNPTWGSYVRELLDDILETAAKGSWKFTDGTTFSYDTLAGQDGNIYLDKYINGEKDRSGTMRGKHLDTPARRIPAQAREFASLLFIGFDMASILLQVKQRTAQGTRVHNPGEPLEPVAVQDPIASYIQNWGRYGGNPKDWRGWSLSWFKSMPGDKSYGPAIKDASGNITNQGAEMLGDMHNLTMAYWDCFIDVNNTLKRLQADVIPGGSPESYFPDTRDLLELGKKAGDKPEVLKIFNYETVDANGRRGAGTPDTNSWGLYEIATQGWKNMLTLCFKGPKGFVTEDQIISSSGEGEKGGLLHKFISEAGKAKVFNPEHLRKLFPAMLFTFCVRLITFTNAGERGKRELRESIIRELNNSPGLSDFRSEIQQVIHMLETKEVVGTGWQIRRDQVGKYVRLYAKVHHIDLYNDAKMEWLDARGQLNHEQKMLKDVLAGNYGPPLPFSVEGDLLTKK